MKIKKVKKDVQYVDITNSFDIIKKKYQLKTKIFY